jgi:hypothetical protein
MYIFGFFPHWFAGHHDARKCPYLASRPRNDKEHSRDLTSLPLCSAKSGIELMVVQTGTGSIMLSLYSAHMQPPKNGHRWSPVPLGIKIYTRYQRRAENSGRYLFFFLKPCTDWPLRSVYAMSTACPLFGSCAGSRQQIRASRGRDIAASGVNNPSTVRPPHSVERPALVLDVHAPQDIEKLQEY